MKVELDVKLLNKLGVSPSLYVWMMLMNEGKTDDAADIKGLNIGEALKLGYIEYSMEIVFTPKFYKDFRLKGDPKWWLEFLDVFPVSTPDGRPLRAKDPKAKSNDKARKKFESIVRGDEKLKALIIECLRFEVKMRDERDQMQFMKGCHAWLNDRIWEQWESHMLKAKEKGTGRSGKYKMVT